MFRLIAAFGLLAFLWNSLDAAPEPMQKGADMKRVSVEEATALIRKELKKADATAPIGAIPLQDLTTDAVWEKLGVQVFKVKYTDELPSTPTFVVKRDQAVPIGIDFGGDGVTAICAADLRGDGKPLLAFSYSWGSGIHRSQLGALDWNGKTPKEFGVSQSLFLPADWHVRAVDAKTVRVEGAGHTFGELELVEKNGISEMRLRLRDDLPANIRKAIR